MRLGCKKHFLSSFLERYGLMILNVCQPWCTGLIKYDQLNWNLIGLGGTLLKRGRKRKGKYWGFTKKCSNYRQNASSEQISVITRIFCLVVFSAWITIFNYQQIHELRIIGKLIQMFDRILNTKLIWLKSENR